MRTLCTIKSNELIATNTYRMHLDCGFEPKLRPGQFVNILLDGFYLRRPVAVCDLTENGIVIYFKVVGKGTKLMSQMKKGENLGILMNLGNGFNTDLCHNSALLVGGGLGAAPLYLLAKELISSKHKKVSVALAFNHVQDIVLEEEYKALEVPLSITTLDGYQGVKGFIDSALERLEGEYDRFYCCGPPAMMKSVAQILKDIPGEFSLEERMGCGAGYCYVCSHKTKNEAKRICKDGPVFDKEEIIW